MLPGGYSESCKKAKNFPPYHMKSLLGGRRPQHRGYSKNLTVVGIFFHMKEVLEHSSSLEWRVGYIDHTPPEVGVRVRKFFITFGRYLPRGTIIYGSRKCRIGAFCTIAKISGEMPKKTLKTGQKGVKKFFSPHTFKIIIFVAIFYFQYFSFWYF